MEEPNSQKAMENYRKGLELISSQENYDHFLHSGFRVILRDDNRTVKQTLALVEDAFGFGGHKRQKNKTKSTRCKVQHER